MDSLLYTFVQDLGLGELPILNKENRALNEELAAKQLEIAKFQNLNQEEKNTVDRIYGHWNNVKESVGIAKNVKVSKRELIGSESKLLKFSEACSARNYRDSTDLRQNIDSLITRNEELEEEITAKATINELLEDEHTTDIEQLLQWAAEMDEHEEDLMTLLKYQDADMARIKTINLRLEKLREKAACDKERLDEAATSNKMSLIALDKTATEFRTLHDDRQKAMDKWREAVDLIEKRDAELESVFKSLAESKAQTDKAELELKEQVSFLNNEKGNISELQRNIVEEERRAQALNEELKAREQELDDLDGQVILEGRETWRVGGEIEDVRTRWRNAKRDYKHKLAKIEAVNQDVAKLKEAKVKGQSDGLSAEERSAEMGKVLDGEQRTMDTLQWELDKARDKKVQADKNLYELNTQHNFNIQRLKGLRLERSNLSRHLKDTTEVLLNKEEMVLTTSYTLGQLEKEINRLKGCEINRSELKAVLDHLKRELESRLSDKRNLDHLVHKMMADVGKVTRDLEKCDRQVAKVQSRLEKVHLENDSCGKETSRIQETIEALLLEERMMKLNENKVRQGLEALNKDLMDLRLKDMEVNEKLREERTDLESRRELYASQSRCLKEEISTIRGEIRERKDRAEKLKIKYDLIVKSLEGGASDGDQRAEKATTDLPSHAFQLVKLAQEKAELRDQNETMVKRLRKEEEELQGLEQAMALLKKSNNDYRASNLQKKKDDADNDEVYYLNHKIKTKTKTIAKLKSQLEEFIHNTAYWRNCIAQTNSDIEVLQRTLEEKSIELRQLDKEMEEQEKKYERAEAVRTQLSKELRTVVTNADFYEQDMDLRTEKEKQRSVLIKLKEISSVDESFSSVCQQNIQKLGFTLPTASRLTSSVPRRALASTSGAAAVTTANSSGATNLFRTSTVKTSAEDGAAIYADLNQVPKTTIAAAATSQKQAVA